jgi:hypothetical protein
MQQQQQQQRVHYPHRLQQQPQNLQVMLRQQLRRPQTAMVLRLLRSQLPKQAQLQWRERLHLGLTSKSSSSSLTHPQLAHLPRTPSPHLQQQQHQQLTSLLL